MKEFEHPARLLVQYMHRIYDRGLTTTSGGNLSVCDSDGTLWITPAGIDKGSLKPEDIVCVHPDGSIDGQHRPSSELPFHSMIYRTCPDIKAIIHAHPVAPVAFSMLRRSPRSDLVGSISRRRPKVSVAPYDIPGSQELGEKLSRAFLPDKDTVFLENHGVCVAGKDLFEAFDRFERIEFASRLEIAGSKLGKLHPCTNDTPLTLVTEGKAPQQDAAQRIQMIRMLRRCYRTGIFTATLGTCSLRLDGGSFLIPPDGSDCAYVAEDDLLCLDITGAPPASTAALHAKIYAAHPEIRAIVQAMPVSAMAFAVTATPFDTKTIPESYILLQQVPTLSMQGQTIVDCLGNMHPAVLVENECAITVGETLLQAFDRMEVLECTAASVLQAKELGQIIHITPEEIERIKIAFHLAD